MENSKSTQCVRVAVKVWPLITSELMLGCTDCISMVPGEPQVHALALKPCYLNHLGNMAHFEKDEVPMLSETHAQLSDEVVDSSFRRLVSRTRSASISIPMASLESYEKETSLVGHTGPLCSNIVATRTKVVESKTEKFSTFNGTDENRWDNDYNRKNEHLMRSGQLGMCNDPYCTTCPTYFKASQPRTRRTSAIFDPKFRLAYVSPESRVVGAGDLVDHPKKIALNYLKGYFFIDLFVVLPLPQIMISFVLRKYLGISGANFAKNLLRAAILLQYFPRLFSSSRNEFLLTTRQLALVLSSQHKMLYTSN
ncbi:putative cyclic nucleotide-gated ion channel 20, chloroplastic [Glycine max]|nr:putative cyclic nucleotide-gated ion channel 20, chloroplastic [Glycine max]